MRSRYIFWSVFLLIAVLAFYLIWTRLDPKRRHPLIGKWWLQQNLAMLDSSNPATGMKAWNELRIMYMTRWAHYDRIVWEVKQRIWEDKDPEIHFTLSLSGSAFAASPLDPAQGKSNCRTVNEALMAILYEESTRKTQFTGSWKTWWDENWEHYYNLRLKALPSGPESTRQ